MQQLLSRRVLGAMRPITGSMHVVQLLTDGLEDAVDAAFAVEPNREITALLMRRHVETKHRAFGLTFLEV